MDFVARAGAVIDRAHRIAGVLLICVVLLGSVSMCQWTKNVALNAQLNDQRQRLPVIVVPDAPTGLYSPKEDDRLIDMFTDLITQSFNSFTPATLSKQYEAVQPYFSPVLLTDSAPYFEKKIRDSSADKRSSAFITDRTSYRVRKYEKNGQQMRDVTLVGELKTFIAGTQAESVPLKLDLTYQKTLVNPANPYGLMLISYHETPLVGNAQSDAANQAPTSNTQQFTEPLESRQSPLTQ